MDNLHTMGVLIVCMTIISICFIWHVLVVNKFRNYVYKKEVEYNKRFSGIEDIFTKNFKEILNLLKNERI